MRESLVRGVAERENQRTISVAGFALRLLACAAIIALWCGFFVMYEATPAGIGRVWMWGAGLLFLPLVWILGEAFSNPVLEYLEGRPWWRDAPSAVRVGVGVLAILPFFVFMIAVTWALRHWLGVRGW